ncbi:hypothetical protein UFOVP139_13 [uncultured Caudovirales phage]|uniref:Uncharacterized protein n=1 Tax=uncultured Caudovirales phage TaxID=2100421 RepID=A0A6J5LC79_9CAUD|nr:hypothetical protein UFOVP139_13 [uncultured Caudovirales phage]
MILTPKERNLIVQFATSEYSGGYNGELDSPLWACVEIDDKSKGGIFAMLQRKGIMWFQKNERENGQNMDYVGLTELGVKAYAAIEQLPEDFEGNYTWNTGA